VTAVVVAAVVIAGCRSASPEIAPSGPGTPGDGPSAPTTPPPPIASPPPAAGGPAPQTEAPAPEDLEDEPTSDPQAKQKEALELCQSAEELLGEGKQEEAIAALDRAYELMLALPGDGDDAYLQAKEDIRRLVAELVRRAYPAGRAAAPSAASWDLGLPIVTNEHVQREILSFTTAERELFLAAYRRSGSHRPMILAKLKEAGLPSQLSWLPLVESWFKVRALSRASALGMWQFISSTGLRYGLNRDPWVDERLDPVKSTDAAIAYLTELHGLFGEWPKALAAYNCGEARVLRLQRRSADEYLDFWDLYELLPQETRRYVPRLFAALQILEDPGRHGMTLPEPEAPLREVATVQVQRAVKLAGLDEVLGLEAGTLASLNPELRYEATPGRPYALRVPAGGEEALLARIASVPEWKRPVPQFVTHRVRRGETLSVIAQRYGTSVSAIMRANHLRSANRIWPGQRLRIPARGRGQPTSSRVGLEADPA
jgi:membrane-bound lytic murein transglycosylase D